MQIIRPTFFLLLLGLAMDAAHGQAKVVPTNVRDTVPFKVDSLKAAIVIATPKPRIKGDTVEYNAEHLGMRPNADVEDLLGRLPGLRIGPDGTISYNGERIDHLLVDGVDIFESTPTMVTRNFDAAKIARVQILDRRSEQAIFTGVDDGIRTKTLNLVLKESAKDGYFGKVEMGGDVDGYHQYNGALAAFRGKEQFTALSLASNTGITSFTNNAGGVSTSVGLFTENTDPLGASAGRGVPRLEAGALHYANTWSGFGDQLSTDFQYSHYVTTPLTVTQSLQAQADSTYGQYDKSQSTNRQVQNWVNGMYNWTPNSKMAVKIIFHGRISNGQNQFADAGSSTFNDTLVNTSERTIRDIVNGQSMGGNVWWRVGMGKRPDRVFSINMGASKSDNVTNGYLYSIEQFYQSKGLVQGMDTVDERKVISSHFRTIGGSMSFTVPIWKGGVLGLSYGASYTRNEPLQATYGRDNGKYQEMVDSLSGHFRTQAINQRASLGVHGKFGNLDYALGTDWLGYGYSQRSLLVDSTLKMSNGSLTPRLLLNYTPNLAMNISFNYNTSVQQPGFAQLTPIANNNDPLYITLGNPNLKPGYNKDFELGFHRFKTWLLNISLKMTLAVNAISTKVSTDSLGRQMSQPVNVNGGRTAGVNFSVNRKVWGIDLGLQAAGTYVRTVNYINTALTRNDAYTGGWGISMGKYVAKKYSLQVSCNVGYFDQVSSINTLVPVHYWTQNHRGLLAIYLIPEVEVGTSFTFTWQERTSAFTSSTSVLFWNGYVARSFLHEMLVAKFQFNNILGADAGISRTNSGNVNSQSSTNVLGRYWMVTVAYHFDRKFKRK